MGQTLQACTPVCGNCGCCSDLGDAISRMYRARREPRPRTLQLSRSSRWRKLRAMVWSMRALESLLENVRCKKIEELYATDWSETPTPDRSPSVQWRMVQKVSRSLSVLDGLLNEVRCKQTEQLYDSDWNTACSEDDDETCESL
mmetsp:Transcript_35577/g.83093  ORF Transcript_35577/g.83093 Transcript_35577/m.83093 type:complete len:144 (-) Transcript_35577:251-682(-)